MNRDENGKIIKDAAFFAEIGKKGGNETKRKKLQENPNFYSDIGHLAGEKVKRELGFDHYSKAGKKGYKSRLKKYGKRWINNTIAHARQVHYKREEQPNGSTQG